MRKFWIIFLSFLSLSALAQTKDCDCSPNLNANLKEKLTSVHYREFKDWLFYYFQKDQTQQQSMKRSSRGNWGGSFTTVIDALPVGGSSNADYAQSKENQKYFKTQQTTIQQQYLTEEQYDQVLEEKFGINQLEAYKSCLAMCEKKLADGITYVTGCDLTDQFFIQVIFNSKTGADSLRFNGPALYSNLEPVGEMIFKPGYSIKDRQSVTQYFKRINPEKKATFNINTPITTTAIEFEGTPPINQQAIPIGTIVASVLNYDQFLKANGLDQMKNDDMSKVLWVPCDGRRVLVSAYSNYSGGQIPDLRGVFLRGANDFRVTFPGVGAVPVNQKNPDNTAAGIFQADALQKHKHSQVWGQNAGNLDGGQAQGNNLAMYRKYRMTQGTLENDGGQEETRPKNVTVYYYIKIN